MAPAHARLFVGRSLVAAGNDQAIETLSAALAAADEANVAPEEIFDAATTLGSAAFVGGQYGVAREGWRIAGAHAEGSRFPRAFAEANARVGEASAIVMEELGVRGNSRMDREVARTAYFMIVQSAEQLAPLAQAEAPGGEVTYAQRAYGEALAWHAVLRAKMRSDGQAIPETEAQGDGAEEIAVIGTDRSRPRCLVRFERPRRLHFPDAAMQRGNLAGVAMRFRINAEGEVIDAQTIARIGHVDFEYALDRVRDQWRATRHEDSPPNCRMDMTLVRSISFVIN